jgi:hypothetical protein
LLPPPVIKVHYQKPMTGVAGSNGFTTPGVHVFNTANPRFFNGHAS